MKTETLTVQAPNLPESRGICVTKKTFDSLKIKNVLVPVDFSPASHAALRFALPLLKRFGANLHLVHVLPQDSPLSSLADLPMVVPEVEMGRRVRYELGRAAAKHGARTVPGNLHISRGSPFAEICNLARKRDIDLIVIATRGNTGLKHLTLGSTAERVVRYSHCPVLVVRDSEPMTNSARRVKSIGRILVPIDFSACSMKSFAYAKQLANEYDATLILLHSIALQYFITGDEYVRYDFSLLMERSEKSAQKQMRELVAKTKRDGVKVESSMQIGHASQQICARAEVEHADIIVMSTHGYTGWKHMWMGSTAEFVVRHAKRPVLVVPTRERRAIK